MEKENIKHYYSKGFSAPKLFLIGAVVVIVLIIIVLISIGSNMKKQQEESKNDIIKGSLAVMLTNGVVYLDIHSDYKGFCENVYTTGPFADVAADGGSPVCHVKSDNKAWCACTTMKASSIEPEGSTFCVDNRGYKRVTQNPGGCDARCGVEGLCVN